MDTSDTLNYNNESKRATSTDHWETLEFSSDSDFDYKEDLFQVEDQVLARKIALVNQAINHIGFTKYHMKLFFLNGMGYAVDSLLALLHSVSQVQVNKEFNHGYSALISADYVGLFFGALFWGFTADIIGRRLAFNISLFLCALFAIAVAGGLSFVAVCSLSATSYFFCGGNLVLDPITFLEFLPRKQKWLLTFLALWWGVGQTITCLIAWPFLANFSCESAQDCPRSSNMGWRYIYITSGTFVLLCGLARVFFIRMVESPKFDIANGNDENVIASLDKIAKSSGRVNTLTLEQLQAVGNISRDSSSKTFAQKMDIRSVFKDTGFHIRGLFATKKIGLSSALNLLSWSLIGLAYPLFNAFLPTYLQSRGADFGDSSIDTTYKNNLIVNCVSIAGPMLAGFMVEIPRFGRRGTMAVGAVLCMAFMFAYTTVRTPAQNLGFSCAIAVCINIYLGTLFAYTPEVLPSAHRATGNGIAVSGNRIMGSLSPVVAYYANTATTAPVYVMAALMGSLAIISMLFPFEVRGKNSV